MNTSLHLIWTYDDSSQIKKNNSKDLPCLFLCQYIFFIGSLLRDSYEAFTWKQIV